MRHESFKQKAQICLTFVLLTEEVKGTESLDTVLYGMKV